MKNQKNIILSGITATGKITLGNYLGAIKNFIKLQNDNNNELFIFVADLHALSLPIDPKQLNENKKSIFALFLACGLDIKKTTIFFQSDISEHSELNWLLSSFVSIGELNRMTQFKDKSANLLKQSNKTESIPCGLFIYPILMAADIILYNPNQVPVGIDQKQHLELTQKIIKKLNKKLNLDFNIPKMITNSFGAKIMALQDVDKKMSKSDPNENNSIFLLDNPEVAYKKIKKALTDSENKIYISEEKKAIVNLLTIYALLENISLEEAQEKFKNYIYADFKEELAILVKEFLINIQSKYNYFLQNVDLFAKEGALRAKKIANQNYLKIKKALGL